ncbi:MAG: DUF5329 domain-containing protein [Rickettsiales bacterium]
MPFGLSPSSRSFCLALLSILFLLALGAPASAADGLSAEKEKIEYLIGFIEKSDCAFVRNGREYTSEKAAEHIRLKTNHAGGRLKTARQFIDYVASRSSFTGIPYFVVTKNGTKIPSSIWLKEELRRYENNLASETGVAAIVPANASAAQ